MWKDLKENITKDLPLIPNPCYKNIKIWKMRQHSSNTHDRVDVSYYRQLVCGNDRYDN